MNKGKNVREGLDDLAYEDLCQAMFENTGTAIAITDENDLIILVNAEFERLSGYSKEKIEGKHWSEFVSSDDVEEMKRLRELRKNGFDVPKNCEFCLVDSEGRARNVLSTVALIPGSKKIIASLIDLTKQKKVENDLRKSKEKYKSYINKSPDGIFIVDQSGQYLDVNPAGLRMSGYTKEEILQLSVRDLTDAIGQDRFKSLVDNGEAMGEVTLLRKDGSSFESEIHAVALGNNRYQGTVRDITKQRLAEKALRRSEELYRMIFENSPLGIFHFDQDAVVTHCNNRLADIVGAPKESILGLKMTEETIDLHMRKAIASALEGKVACFEGVYPMSLSINQVPVRATFSSIRSEDGAFLGGIGVCEDISERIKAEIALRKSETYNRLILNGITEIVALVEVVNEADFRFVQANNNMLNLLGLQEAQVIGSLIENVMSAEIAKIYLKKMKKVIKEKEPLLTEQNLGELGDFQIRLYPVLDEEGRCTHVIVLTINVSEKKKMEEHQIRLQKLESLGLLAGGIAHDFNNILTAILGNVSLVKMKIEDPNFCEFKEKLLNWVREIERASHQAKDLTQQLLTFSKGGNPIMKVVSIGDLLKETTGFALRGSNVLCEYKISNDLWTVEVDEGQMNQVIQNLIVNANQAMPGGGVIKIFAENIHMGDSDTLAFKKGNYVRFSVQDQGYGIPKEYFEKIFDPYFTTKQMGSGLGLTTTYSVVRKHHGYITLESEVGAGTTFHVYLPASRNAVATKLIGIQTSLVGKGKVLVMDDEKIIREVLSEMLSFLEYEPVCVKDGSEAIKVYSEAMGSARPFDLVILDLTIPGGLGGKDTIKSLLEANPQIKAIVSSGYSNDPVMGDHKKYGFTDVVTKPYNVEELAKVLEKVMSHPQNLRRLKPLSKTNL